MLAPAQLQMLLEDDGLPPLAPGLLAAACRRLPPPGRELVDVRAVADEASERSEFLNLRKRNLEVVPAAANFRDSFPSDLREVRPVQRDAVPCADPRIAALAPNEARQELLGAVGRMANARRNNAFALFRNRDPGGVGEVPVSVAIVRCRTQ
eukprot:gnl/MRDRNA2_/MRDRNA2_26044_c0_seq1.p1 gnl/MRDRNA2_/MRDRNA2_26044_c0~~gnl/MRDRNA2_/MRDRNA2_26044_c0_seq1.p1  ORF type:complete len:162 (-),score=30.62 gnl/MRDRNA2_/MRDRNA2_26044_c0_seq1:429-884(-)